MFLGLWAFLVFGKDLSEPINLLATVYLPKTLPSFGKAICGVHPPSSRVDLEELSDRKVMAAENATLTFNYPTTLVANLRAIVYRLAALVSDKPIQINGLTQTIHFLWFVWIHSVLLVNFTFTDQRRTGGDSHKE